MYSHIKTEHIHRNLPLPPDVQLGFSCYDKNLKTSPSSHPSQTASHPGPKVGSISVSRPGYIICRAQSKMKMGGPSLKKYQEFLDGVSRASNQAWGPSEHSPCAAELLAQGARGGGEVSAPRKADLRAIAVVLRERL